MARTTEQREFLKWLSRMVVDKKIDAILIAGDIFDSTNPSAEAEELWYGFIADVKRARPGIRVVAVAGNHDSGDRLEAPDPLLRRMGVETRGGLRVQSDGTIDWGSSVVVLKDEEDSEVVLVLALGYLRPADLYVALGKATTGDGANGDGGSGDGGSGDGGSASEFGAQVGAVYERALAAARCWWKKSATEGEAGEQPAIVAMGHLHLAHGEVSDLSERQITAGGLQAVDSKVFGKDIGYVALGHLHKPQKFEQGRIRYSGAPLPMDVSERNYRSEIVIIETDNGKVISAEGLVVPRFVDMVRVPERGEADVDEALEQLRSLPVFVGPDWSRPVLEVVVRLERPEPDLRSRVEEVLAGRGFRLSRLRVVYPGSKSDQAGIPPEGLKSLRPSEVLVRHWDRRNPGRALPERLMNMFNEVEKEVYGSGD